VVEDAWNGSLGHDFNDIVGFKNKLKLLKQKLKSWSHSKKVAKEHDRKSLQEQIIDIDMKLEKGVGSSVVVADRENAFQSIVEMDQK
ncbi:hypothetical protein Tco_1472666, partial [Tanacetum coccineum]